MVCETVRNAKRRKAEMENRAGSTIGARRVRTKAAASAKLRAHGFTKAYVAQYVDQTGGAVLSVVTSSFVAPGAMTTIIRFLLLEPHAPRGNKIPAGLATLRVPRARRLLLVSQLTCLRAR